MSYDLFFKNRPGVAEVGTQAFADYFRGRKNYEVSDKQAIYTNESTGVYFIFDLGEPVEGEPGLAPISFNLNYFRPHIFGSEGELEVSTFVQQFSLLVSDPQIDGMGEGEYSTEAFLRGWNRGNELGYKSFLGNNRNEQVFSAPSLKIENAWRWNLMKDSLQEQLGEDVFVPRIMFLLADGQVRTTTVWGDGIPIALPEVDVILIPRDQLAPVKFLLRKKDIAQVAWDEAAPLIAEFPTESGPLDYRLLKYEEIPPSITTFIKNLHPMPGKPDVLPIDKVLDTELVDRARSENA